jgi:hypothetical protein
MYCLTLNYLKKLKIMQNNYNKIKINYIINIYCKKKYNNKNRLDIINNNCDFSKLKKISDCNDRI